jgi:hypothetical protein
MNKIPTKADLANSQANAAAAAAQRKVEDDTKRYTQCIVDAMGKGEKSFSDRIGNVSAEVERRLKADFAAQGWTLEVRNMRTGCTIFWS